MSSRDPQSLGWVMRPTVRARARAWWRRAWPAVVPASPEDYAAAEQEAHARGVHLEWVGLHHRAHQIANQRVRGVR